MQIKIAGDGSVTGSTTNCTIGGSIIPDATGVNVYTTQLFFTGSGCPVLSGLANGITINQMQSNAQTLVTSVISQGKNSSFVWIGTKQ